MQNDDLVHPGSEIMSMGWEPWVMHAGYGLREAWVKRGSTVCSDLQIS